MVKVFEKEKYSALELINLIKHNAIKNNHQIIYSNGGKCFLNEILKETIENLIDNEPYEIKKVELLSFNEAILKYDKIKHKNWNTDYMFLHEAIKYINTNVHMLNQLDILSSNQWQGIIFR